MANRFQCITICVEEANRKTVTRGPDRDEERVDILEAFVYSADPVMFASEVAAFFDKSDEWARQRCNELVEDSYLNAKKPGRRSKAYWITDEGRQLVADERGPADAADRTA